MYLGSTANYDFHAIEIHNCPSEELEQITKACELVELDVWNACEDFSDYVKKQSALFYAKKGAQIVGFALYDVNVENDRLLVAANECMVLREHQGNGLPTIFSSILTGHIRRDNRKRGEKRAYKAITFISATVHFKLMQSFFRYDKLAVASSFRPDKDILNITKKYIAKKNFNSLSDLFFLNAAFPNAVKTSTTTPPPSFVPKDFNSERGDAFLYVCRIEKFWLLGLISAWSRIRYGFKYSKNLMRMGRLNPEKIIYTR